MKRESVRALVAIAVTAVSAIWIAGCGADGGSPGDRAGATDRVSEASGQTGPNGPTAGSSEFSGSITVSAAASLSDAFTDIGDLFMSAHPKVKVSFNFDSSSALATQIMEGAPADVFASAGEANMDRLVAEGLIASKPETFARNDLVIVTKPRNPQRINDLGDLVDVGVVSLCAEAAPCGTYAADVLQRARVTVPERSITRGPNVTATLTAVSEGDAVAGIVYRTDAARAGRTVTTVPIPPADNVVAEYPIGVMAATKNPDAAEAFRSFVLSPDGQKVLARFKFLPSS